MCLNQSLFLSEKKFVIMVLFDNKNKLRPIKTTQENVLHLIVECVAFVRYFFINYCHLLIRQLANLSWKSAGSHSQHPSTPYFFKSFT